jgi:hypothetical protein
MYGVNRRINGFEEENQISGKREHITEDEFEQEEIARSQRSEIEKAMDSIASLGRASMLRMKAQWMQ